MKDVNLYLRDLRTSEPARDQTVRSTSQEINKFLDVNGFIYTDETKNEKS